MMAWEKPLYSIPTDSGFVWKKNEDNQAKSTRSVERENKIIGKRKAATQLR